MKIQLDENWAIVADTYSWKLESTETVTRTNKDTEEEEEYEKTDTWYYPRLSTCLETYTEKSLQPSKSVEEILQTLKRIEDNIGNIKQDIFRPKK